MPPIAKDSDTLTATTETAARSGSAPASSNDSAVKPQPVALEVPVTVNGARTVEGSDKREPFSESTKTVMVHGLGAVIRLSSSMAPGQLLFLTNERTKKEVVCQVVKSKSYRSASGYVELEFTEPAVGFWGMRFPGDRIGPGPQAGVATAARPSAGTGSAVPTRPAEQKTEQQASSTPTRVAAKSPSPAPVAPSLDSKPLEPEPLAPAASAPSRPASPTAPGPSIVPPPLDSASLLGSSKPKTDLRAPVAAVPTSLDSEAPLVEPWLKKPAPASKVPAAPTSVASSEAPTKSQEPETSLPTARNFELARPSDKPASFFAPPEAPANLSKVDLSSIVPFFEVKPAAPEAPPPQPQAPAASDSKSEELKQHTTRLQEELGRMQFTEPEATPSSPAQPEVPEVEIPSFPLTEQSISVLKTELVHESAAQLLENSGASNPTPLLPELQEPSEPAKPANDAPASPLTSLESLEQEELKIPAWLEPLARNASAPSSTQELVLREKTKRRSEKPQLEELTAQLAAPAEKEQVAELRVPQFGSALPFEEEVDRAEESSAGKSDKGTIMTAVAVAAGILVLAGGAWWYMNQQSAGVHASVPAVQESVAEGTSPNLQKNSTKEATQGTMLSSNGDAAVSEAKPAAVNSSAPTNVASRLSNSAPASASAAVVRNAQAAPNAGNGGSVAASAASSHPEATPEEVKKSALGEVHLAAPKIAPKRTTPSGAETDAGISLSEEQPEDNADSLGVGLGIANSQPAAPVAPVAVGGDVKQAKLISSVPPVYPALAKAQHVSGNVTIDALIDANGRVTTTKVISGPTLLEQAALDALKQWKYRPATLDGKAVPMHLTVTIQFRLQQ